MTPHCVGAIEKTNERMKTQPDNPERILMIKPSALGDVVTAVPVLRGVRRSFPDCHIS